VWGLRWSSTSARVSSEAADASIWGLREERDHCKWTPRGRSEIAGGARFTDARFGGGADARLEAEPCACARLR
jgi:hypothetical protein